MQTQPLGPRLSELASATGTLSKRQCHLIGGMLKELGRLDKRKTALAAAVAHLNPGGELSDHQVSLRLELALKRLSGQPLKRILAGHRLPTMLEIELLILASDGPTSARRLWEELREI